MSIVVAYSADRYGAAALEHAAELARKDRTRLVVVNATLGSSLVDSRFAHDADIAALQDRLALNAARIEAVAKAVEDVAGQADPNGRELARWTPILKATGVTAPQAAPQPISTPALPANTAAPTPPANVPHVIPGEAIQIGRAHV